MMHVRAVTHHAPTLHKTLVRQLTRHLSYTHTHTDRTIQISKRICTLAESPVATSVVPPIESLLSTLPLDHSSQHKATHLVRLTFGTLQSRMPTHNLACLRAIQTHSVKPRLGHVSHLPNKQHAHTSPASAHTYMPARVHTYSTPVHALAHPTYAMCTLSSA